VDPSHTARPHLHYRDKAALRLFTTISKCHCLEVEVEVVRWTNRSSNCLLIDQSTFKRVSLDFICVCSSPFATLSSLFLFILLSWSLCQQRQNVSISSFGGSTRASRGGLSFEVLGLPRNLPARGSDFQNALQQCHHQTPMEACRLDCLYSHSETRSWKG
jgi:hypothetical protein